MPKKKKAVKAAAPKKAKVAKSKVKKAAMPKAAKILKPKKKKAPKAKKALKPKKTPKAKKALKAKKTPKASQAPKLLNAAEAAGQEQLLSSEVVFEGSLFRVLRDRLVEPGGAQNERDIIRHNGSVVILAIDRSKSKKDPWIVVERQYRHAAKQFLWELPAGKLEPGEDALAGAQRELAEETGYRARKWKKLVEYYPSPGFLGESMKIFLAEGLLAGSAHPEDDEQIEFRLVKLSEALKMIDKGAIFDGKTLTGVLLYARMNAARRKS